jgi:hypothetical protein
MDDLTIEHRRVEDLREKVKYMLKKELSLYKAVSDVQATADTWDHTKKEIGKLRWLTALDAAYMSKKVGKLYIILLWMVRVPFLSPPPPGMRWAP